MYKRRILYTCIHVYTNTHTVLSTLYHTITCIEQLHLILIKCVRVIFDTKYFAVLLCREEVEIGWRRVVERGRGSTGHSEKALN